MSHKILISLELFFFFKKRYICKYHGYLQENVQRVKKELDVLAF